MIAEPLPRGLHAGVLAVEAGKHIALEQRVGHRAIGARHLDRLAVARLKLEARLRVARRVARAAVLAGADHDLAVDEGDIVALRAVLAALEEAHRAGPGLVVLTQAGRGQGVQGHLQVREVRALVPAIADPPVVEVALAVALALVGLQLDQVGLGAGDDLRIPRTRLAGEGHHRRRGHVVGEHARVDRAVLVLQAAQPVEPRVERRLHILRPRAGNGLQRA